jgi:hypothetical protein
MNDLNLKLVLKGERNYVHGTTMFDEVVRLLSDVGCKQLNAVEFLIHKMTSANLKLVVEPYREVSPVSDDIALIRFVVNGQSMQACVKLQEGMPETRMPYDESAVTNRCEINVANRSIRLLNDGFGFSPIEVLVSMNKALHLAVLDKPADTSWVFCRWDSPAWPLLAGLSGVTITLKQTLGTRLTRADVELAGQLLGQIYFSAKAAAS